MSIFIATYTHIYEYTCLYISLTYMYNLIYCIYIMQMGQILKISEYK